jgi:hypothetical protein
MRGSGRGGGVCLTPETGAVEQLQSHRLYVLPDREGSSPWHSKLFATALLPGAKPFPSWEG